ncbi:MAG: isoleucine--tRNA ligase [Bacteroidota bacterium]|nr:isoleucine--tRNA ligase [Bacteroidota bacterium]
MSKKYKEYKKLDLPAIADEVLNTWKKDDTFGKSVSNREGSKNFVFYEGPPSANGLPGIHHVMARSIKDIFCRYKTLKGFQVKRKAGWDTHGLPIELGVEKSLGITKEDIGKKISIEDYNNACRTDVMKYTGIWNDLTEKMGYWVDMDDPYITYENSYIESVWNLLSKIYDKGMLYKGYTIQPYSPAAGTGLSSHELNQPGCYRNVKDTTVVAQFKVIKNEQSSFLFQSATKDVYFIAWTTTPWTLPSNTALAVGNKIDYVLVKTFNQYTYEPIHVILAKNLLNKHFSEKSAVLNLEDYKSGDKNIPFKILDEFKGSDLEGIRYEQLMPYAQPEDGDAFKVIIGDFVTTQDGTGIVHLAPSFGSDDFRVAVKNKIGSLTLVDTQGKFKSQVTDYAGEYVKEQYIEPGKFTTEYKPVDVRIAIKLKEENKAFKVEKYEHSYPHCWRTDKPILYYPLDSWFIKTTAVKDRLIELNKTINWKPESTGTGRFGNWLENLMDWNLSRSRYWGIPIPIWTTEGKSEQICIGSAEQLKNEIDKSIAAGFMDKNPLGDFNPGDFSKENYKKFDLHRPYVDDIILVSPTGNKMFREADLIDVWFDSGAMPYAQLHYPFENKESLNENFPADFIAEGVDQTRGWFFTLHAISTMVFDSIAYKNVVSNGLVLDKNGQKMSKRLGNATDPFETLSKYGPDATRWYMITNAQPWDNLKFDLEGIVEVQRKFFSTLYNTYNFFALYANIDGFSYKEDDIPVDERPEIDRWILSVLNSLVKEVDQSLNDYESTRAGRAIQEFVDEHLSNWYVRLCRRRFWKGEYTNDKIAAYQTLYTCLDTVAKLGSVIAPFFMDKLYTDLNSVTGKDKVDSVHLGDFPTYDSSMVDKELEERMEVAQRISSMVLSLRKKQNIRVRQPLGRIMVPVQDEHFKSLLEKVKDLVLSEVNVKEMEFLTDTEGVLVKKIKPNFKTIGPKYGKQMKAIAQAVAEFTQADIAKIENKKEFELQLNGDAISLDYLDFEITSEDIPGWLVASEGKLTVALDITITEELKEEGIAREIINRIQNLRKEKGLEVTDKIELKIKAEKSINSAINNNLNYICTETLASTLEIVNDLDFATSQQVEVDDEVKTLISIVKLN